MRLDEIYKHVREKMADISHALREMTTCRTSTTAEPTVVVGGHKVGVVSVLNEIHVELCLARYCKHVNVQLP